MGDAGGRFDITVHIAVENNAGVRRDGPLIIAAREGTLFHIALIHLLVGISLKVGTSYLIKGNGVILHDQSWFIASIFPAE